MKALPIFVNLAVGDCPISFEVFTDSRVESEALRSLRRLKSSASSLAKNAVKGVLGESGVAAVKKCSRVNGMKVLILGGTGAIGVHLTRILADMGHDTLVTSRSERTSENPCIRFLRGDAHDLSFLGQCLGERL